MLVVGMTPEIAEAFYEECIKRGIDTADEREKLLVEWAKAGKLKCAFTTNRTKEEFIADTVKNYGRVGEITDQGFRMYEEGDK